jgi:phosphonate transport system substrate-binding protein
LIFAVFFTTGLINTAIAENKLRLNFGVYSANKPSAMVKVFRPVLKELEASMSARLNREVDIRMQIAKDYDQGISHLVNGRVDFSHFGPASYVEAKRMNKDIKILAVENRENSNSSNGIIAVSKDSDIESISDLNGRSFAFGDEGSTIGRFLSQLQLEQAGIRAVDLSRYEYLGRHDKVGTAVGAGAFDAGALNEKTFRKLVKAGENIRELVRFPNVSKPWIARSRLDSDVFAALRDSLLNVTNPATLAAMKIDGFMEGGDEDYRVIRQAMENNHVFFAEHDESSRRNVSALTDSDSVAEPSMQAAVKIHDTNTGVSNSASIPDSEFSVGSNSTLSSNEPGQPQATTSRTITLNIELPKSLFQADNKNGPDSITINVKLPEQVSAEY